MVTKPDFKEMTKHIGPKRDSKQLALRKQLLAKGMLCRDCHRYLARSHYSVCKRCYEKRIQRFLKTGGVYVLTPKMHRQIEKELRE